MNSLNGGYAMIKYNSTQEELQIAYRSKKPVLCYDENHRAHWAVIEETATENVDEETQEPITIYEYSYRLIDETVVANPTLSGNEETLKGAEIDGIKYKVGGGSEVHLYSHKFSFIRSGTKVLIMIFEVFNASSTPIKVKDLNRGENFICNGSYGEDVICYFTTSEGNNNDVALSGVNKMLGTVTINPTDTITQIF